MMKAVVKAKREPGLWLEEVPIPEVGCDEVLIRVLKASICGTDVHIYNWDDWAQKTIPVPMTIGHEFTGVVDTVGDHVKGFAPGDLVVYAVRPGVVFAIREKYFNKSATKWSFD